jgi:hypothetical protein
MCAQNNNYGSHGECRAPNIHGLNSMPAGQRGSERRIFRNIRYRFAINRTPRIFAIWLNYFEKQSVSTAEDVIVMGAFPAIEHHGTLMPADEASDWGCLQWAGCCEGRDI